MTTDTQNSEWYESKAWPTIISTNDYDLLAYEVLRSRPFGSQMAGRKMDNVDYRYGFNGKEIDNWNAQGEAPPSSGGGPPGPPPDPTGDPDVDPANSSIVYDYGFRIYNPTIAKFLSVDPLTKSYPWNSPFAFAENDVIRSIDLDGLERLGVTSSLYNMRRIKESFKNEDYKKIYEILEYSSTHGWVDDQGKTSNFIERKYYEKHGESGPGIASKSTFIYDNIPKEHKLVDEFGDINDHGGYMKVEFFNWETKKFESLGILPLSKIKEHSQLTTYSDNDAFRNIEPEYNIYDAGRELRSRAIGLIPDALKKFKGPFFIDTETTQYEHMKFYVKGRLRALGSNSVFEVEVKDENTFQFKTWRMEYQIDEKGNESFTESVINGKGS